MSIAIAICLFEKETVIDRVCHLQLFLLVFGAVSIAIG